MASNLLVMASNLAGRRGFFRFDLTWQTRLKAMREDEEERQRLLLTRRHRRQLQECNQRDDR